jgi:hypothetical protein
MGKNDKLIEDGQPKILLADEKHHSFMYIANSEDHLDKIAKDILKRRLNEGWYNVGDDPKNPTGYETEEEVRAMPDGMVRNHALKLWQDYKNQLSLYEDARNFLEMVKDALGYEFNSEDKYIERNIAYMLLYRRREHEYEDIRLETPDVIEA